MWYIKRVVSPVHVQEFYNPPTSQLLKFICNKELQIELIQLGLVRDIMLMH